MNKLFLPLLSVLLFTACSEQVVVNQEKKPLVVQLSPVIYGENPEVHEFPAVISAVKDVDIKFEVSGRLTEVNLTKGKKVTKGQVLAQIDPAPFTRRVEEQRIRHEVATKELRRVERMFADKLVSQSQLDNSQSQFDITKLGFDNAKQDLSYATVVAPFDAIVADRFIENNSYIKAGETIAVLQDRSKIYFSFDVPERIMAKNNGRRDVEAYAYITGAPEQKFELEYVEHETNPDPITQTYNVTFASDNIDGMSFIPGTRAIVKAQRNSLFNKPLLLPITALVGSNEQGFDVWVYNPQTSVVNKRKVEVGTVIDNFALIVSGVNASELVVSAAANKMHENLSVKPYQRGK